MDDSSAVQIQTTDQHDEELVNGVSQNVAAATGAPANVAPTTAETPLEAGDSLQEKVDRLIVRENSTGIEPSGSFLSLLKQKLQKKHPGAVIKERKPA